MYLLCFIFVDTAFLVWGAERFAPYEFLLTYCLLDHKVKLDKFLGNFMRIKGQNEEKLKVTAS